MSFHKVLNRFEKLGASADTLREVVFEAASADLIDAVLRDPPVSLNVKMGNGPALRHLVVGEELATRLFTGDRSFKADAEHLIELLQLIIKMPLTSAVQHKGFSQTANRFALWIYLDMDHTSAVMAVAEMVDLMVNCKRNPMETIDSALRGHKECSDQIVTVMNMRRFELLLNPYQRGQVRKYLRSMDAYAPTP
jgi:hypothetical protein